MEMTNCISIAMTVLLFWLNAASTCTHKQAGKNITLITPLSSKSVLRKIECIAHCCRVAECLSVIISTGAAGRYNCALKASTAHYASVTGDYLVPNMYYEKDGSCTIKGTTRKCPNGYIVDSQTCQCYKIVHNVKKNWHAARASCQQDSGADLVAVETSDEWEFLKAILKYITLSSGIVWSCGFDNVGNNNKDDYIWLSTNKRFDYADWIPGNPSTIPQKHVSKNGWDDVKPSYKYNYICEL